MNARNTISVILAAACAAALIAAGVIAHKWRDSRAEAQGLAQQLGRSQADCRRHAHSEVRQWVIRQQLARLGPVIVLGDSITEGGPLPPSICGRALINAGIGGANVRYMLDVAPQLLAGINPALIVVALGTNDAYPAPNRAAVFGKAYAELLQAAGKVAPRLAVVGVPALDPKGRLTAASGLNADVASSINAELPQLAAGAGATFVDVRKVIEAAGLKGSTTDGVHLSPQAYDYWRGALLSGISTALQCGPIAGAD